MLIILLAVIGILIVWQANRAGVRRQEVYRTQSLQENMIKENERASAGVTLPASSTDDTEEKGQKSAEASGDTEAQADDTADDTAQDSSKGAEDTESEAAAAKVQEPEISVLLMTDGYKGYTHQSVKLQFHGSYHLLGSQEMDYADGETLELTAGSRAILLIGAILLSIRRREVCVS